MQGSAWYWGWGWYWWFFAVLLLVIIAIVIARLVTVRSVRSKDDTVEEELRRRYLSGEITEEEYRRRKEFLDRDRGL